LISSYVRLRTACLDNRDRQTFKHWKLFSRRTSNLSLQQPWFLDAERRKGILVRTQGLHGLNASERELFRTNHNRLRPKALVWRIQKFVKI